MVSGKIPKMCYSTSMSNLKETTLCYVEKDDCYLMLYRNKKKNDVNQGKWIGIGGHLEEGETPEQCLLRECMEEANLTLTNYKYRAHILFEFYKDGKLDFTEITHLYTATGFTGNLIECNEGELKWIPKNKIFNLPLWEGDKIFLQKLFDDQPFFKLKLIYQDGNLPEEGIIFSGESK